MRISCLFLILTAATIIAASATPSFGTDGHAVLQKVGIYGQINWSRGIICTKGRAMLIQRASDTGETGYVVEEAKREGLANLLEAVKAVRIDASSRVTDLMERSAWVKNQLQSLVENARIAEREYLPDGNVELTLTVELTGAFAELVLPDDLKHVPEIKTLSKPPEKAPVENPEPTSLPSGPTQYTGLVIDARGLPGQPAMCPRVLDENGDEVYGTTYVSREFAVQQGTVVYATDHQAALHSLRVSDNPLTVRALRTVGPSECDFLISNADAWNIRSASENLAFLKKCKVVVVLDGSQTQCLFSNPQDSRPERK